MSKTPTPLTNEEAARLIAGGKQVGYRTVKVNGHDRLEPINPQLQVILENALWRLRVK